MKKILLVISILLGILIPEVVSAATFKVDCLLYDHVVREKDGKIENKQIKKIVRNEDNRFVYSLEYDKEISSNNLSPLDTYSKVDSNTLDKIKLISYYGYGYKSHTDIKWYAITQLMIWREIDKSSNYYFEDNKYDLEIATLNKLVDNHYVLPSFANQKVFVDETGITNIEDTNGVLNDYSILNNDGISVTKKNNIFIINSKLDRNHSILFSKATNLYSGVPNFYLDNSGSDILLPGNFKPIYFSVVIRALCGDIKVSLVDKDDSLPSDKFDGVVFSLYDSNNKLISRKVVSNGELIFKEMLYGKYYLRQDNSIINYGYSNELLPINVDNKLKEIIIYNQIKKGKIRFSDSFESDGFEIRFNIYDVNNNIIDSFTSTNIDNYEALLPYGIYSIRQVDDLNYNTDSLEFEIDKDSQIINLNSRKILEEIEVPDAYINKTNYISYIYSFMIIVGIIMCGVKYEKS